MRCLLTHPSKVLNDQFNFKNMPCSLMVLVRMILLDGWSKLLRVFTRPAGAEKQRANDKQDREKAPDTVL